MLARIKERQPILKKWRDDYENCTPEEDKLASDSFDDMVDDIAFLIEKLDKAAELLHSIRCGLIVSESRDTYTIRRINKLMEEIQ